MTPTLLFQADTAEAQETGPQQIIFGQWSPNSRYIVFWVGILSASILADGLPPLVLDTETGETYPAATAGSADVSGQEWSLQNTALVNPRYHSWSPDSSRLAITAGGYRSAQINKWLNLVEVASGRVTTVISETEQVPGIVAWSPQGELIAYAAVPAGQTGQEWADLMTFENPAIAGRRIYLLDPVTGQYRRLNEIESYQDAPVWSSDGSQLFYVQRNGAELQLMAADPQTGQAEAIPDARQPVELNDPYQPEVGYYGQFGRDELLAAIPEEADGAHPCPAN
jgi:Tol biopolymer transport system component